MFKLNDDYYCDCGKRLTRPLNSQYKIYESRTIIRAEKPGGIDILICKNCYKKEVKDVKV